MTATLDEAGFDVLSASCAGEVIRPADAGYDDAREIFNAMFDLRPAVIVRCTSAQDVAAAVRFARRERLEVAVRCGGHSVAGLGSCDGGIVIHLGGLKGIEVDPVARIARVGGGVLWGELDRATQEHGLHTPGGRVTTTGVGGFTTGGGYGWTSSVYGLALDNLVAAEVVTADGAVLEASEEENADLFWGIRGGGGNFGIVTRFDFRLHEVGPIVLAGMALWPVSEAPRVLRAWRDHVDGAPNELSTAAGIVTAPPDEFVPEHLRLRPCVAVLAMYVGDLDAGAAVVQPIRDLAPDLDAIVPMPYLGFQAMLDAGAPFGLRSYWRGEYMTALPDAAIDAFVAGAGEPISPFSQVILFRIGQGVTAGADEATAFSHRDAEYLLHPISVWEDPADDARQIAFARGVAEAMRPFTTGAPYLNFTPEDRVREAYGASKYERLVALKDRYDPDNLFRRNNNIKPSRAGSATRRRERSARTRG
jgi:FAD/FMN-containing dehydrogenase